MDPLISVIIPLYNEEAILPLLYQRLTDVLTAVGEPYEILLVNDGSTDGTPVLSYELANRDPHITAINLSRNFGHQIAITAGLDYSRGEAVITMDGDLQDPPEVIPELMRRWRESYEVVYAIRINRPGETWFKKATAHVFYRVLRWFSQMDIPIDTGDFRLMSRKVVAQLKTLRERSRFLRGLSRWVGFKQIGVPYERAPRCVGSTKFSFFRMFHFALDGVISFSLFPLRISVYCGLAVSILCFGCLLYALYARFILHRTVEGWTSLMVILLGVGGVILINLGILGEYVGRIYEETKRRPLYIVDTLFSLEHPLPFVKSAPAPWELRQFTS
ncbi:MAG: glycosyltransferase family 2 protein [Elusimicrobia bacterium]|nr:glycosyltransferase family 2 protein [Elusimicrobiota bacterium]